MIHRLCSLLPVAAALSLMAAAAWSMGGGVNPLADPADPLGRSMLGVPGPLATAWMVLAAAGLVIARAALRARPGSAVYRRRRRVVVTAVVVALLLLNHSLIMVLGYVPFQLVLLASGRTDGLLVLLSPGLGIQALVAAAAAVLLLGLRSVLLPGALAGADRADAARRTRKWALVAIEAPLAYALSRVLMFFEVPGFTSPEFDDTVRAAGLGLALAASIGALLTWGLVARWGERFPWWAPGLAGRPVPIGLAVVPAFVVAALVMAAFRGMVLDAVVAGAAELRSTLSLPLVALPHLLWPVWSVALALAAIHYRHRRLDERHSRPNLGDERAVRPAAASERGAE